MQRRSEENHVYRPSSKVPAYGPPDSLWLNQVESLNLTLPIDVMVSTLSARRPSENMRPHVFSGTFPGGSFVNAGNGLYVSSPELCFFQMASEYALAKLIELGIELCGSYSLSEKANALLPGKAPSSIHEKERFSRDEKIFFSLQEKASFSLQEEPSSSRQENASANAGQDVSEQTKYDLQRITTKKKLKAFIAHMKGRHGYRNAVKALRYIADDSASPMETILVILLTLPYKYGGYGFQTPELNGRIYPEKGVRFEGRSFYRGDLIWRKEGVVAEYNSDLEHANPDRMAADAIRRSDLELCGISEVTVTKGQIKSEELFDKVARQIAAKVGKNLRYNALVFSKARSELRRILF